MILPSELFSYDWETRTMCACASDGPLHEMFQPGNGFPTQLNIRSHRTGDVITAKYLSRRETDGELQSWTYHNYEHSVSIEIFND